MILALDPGPTETAWVFLNQDGSLLRDSAPVFGKDENRRVRDAVIPAYTDTTVVCEMIASYGMPVGAEVFDTCVWIGEFRYRTHRSGAWHTLTRSQVKQALCGRTAGVNDGVIRQCLIDLYGPGKEKAVGTKKAPGPLHGVSGDVWAALAVARAWLLRSETKTV